MKAARAWWYATATTTARAGNRRWEGSGAPTAPTAPTDRRPTEHFTSAILPPYLRSTPSIDALIPALYLKGVSTSAFPAALQAMLGDGVVGLSANQRRATQASLGVGVPGLVVVGATEDGHKELLAIQDGERESHLSWLHLLQDLKARGLKGHAFLAVADGALGSWKALEEALPGARIQQCWVHKTANVLDKLACARIVT